MAHDRQTGERGVEQSAQLLDPPERIGPTESIPVGSRRESASESGGSTRRPATMVMAAVVAQSDAQPASLGDLVAGLLDGE